MATEIEMNLTIPSMEVLEKVLSDTSLAPYILDEFNIRQMTSSYYDTEDGMMAAKKWSLRLRREGDQTVAAIKTASESDGFILTRNEWQCSADMIEDAIPMLIEQGAPSEIKTLLKGKQLVEVCRADFTRKSAILYMTDGVRVEIAGDWGTLTSGGRSQPIIELELELLFGDSAAMPPLCSLLQEKYGLVVEEKSKYQRAMQLREAV